MFDCAAGTTLQGMVFDYLGWLIAVLTVVQMVLSLFDRK